MPQQNNAGAGQRGQERKIRFIITVTFTSVRVSVIWKVTGAIWRITFWKVASRKTEDWSEGNMLCGWKVSGVGSGFCHTGGMVLTVLNFHICLPSGLYARGQTGGPQSKSGKRKLLQGPRNYLLICFRLIITNLFIYLFWRTWKKLSRLPLYVQLPHMLLTLKLCSKM